MKNFLLFAFAIFFFTSNAQQFNDFEQEANLDIHLGPDSQDSIWQIGSPQKTFFNSAFSEPNALVTDVFNTYPPYHSSSFHVDFSEISLQTFPFIQISWQQKLDFESGADGAMIELSYDGGETWSNVFTDPVYRPFVVGLYDIEVDTLSNGEVGMTGTSDWEFIAVCWGQFEGTQPDFVDQLRVRFTMISDENDTQQDGWMIDNINMQIDILGVVTDDLVRKEIKVYPNPVEDNLMLEFEEMISPDSKIEIYDLSGKKHQSETPYLVNGTHTTYVGNLIPGIYQVMVKNEEGIYYQKFVKD